MRSMSKRAFWREHPTEETVQVTHGSQIIGTFVPVGAETPDAMTVARSPIALSREAGDEARQRPVVRPRRLPAGDGAGAGPSRNGGVGDVVSGGDGAGKPAVDDRVVGDGAVVEAPIRAMTQAQRDKVLGRVGKA